MLNGGIYEELARRLVIDPFERATHASVEVVPASAAQIVTRLMAERTAPTVDVVVIDQLVMGKAIESGLFERISPGNVPSLRDLAAEAVDARGFGPMVHCHNLALGFNAKRLGVDPPTSWADLWHSRFKGLVVPGAIELTPGLLFLLEANAMNGGSYTNVDPGFAALARLAPNVRKYFHNIGEVRPLVSQDNVIVAISSNMLQAEINQGSAVGIVFPAEGCLGSPAVAQIVRGTKVKDLAEQFIDFYLTPDAQLGWARDYNVSVFNQRAGVTEEMKARIANKTVFFDPNAVSRGREAWVERWTREIRG
jgi:putative spermidine/putrescine transport system substrate-binding protein